MCRKRGRKHPDINGIFTTRCNYGNKNRRIGDINRSYLGEIVEFLARFFVMEVDYNLETQIKNTKAYLLKEDSNGEGNLYVYELMSLCSVFRY